MSRPSLHRGRAHARFQVPRGATRALLACLLVLLGDRAVGDVRIESTDPEGHTARVIIANDRARIDNDPEDLHLLLDLNLPRILAVSRKNRFAMDLGSPLPERSEHAALATAAVPKPDIRLENLGDGPTIAGFPTVHYRVMVNDVHCHDEFLAASLLEDARIRRFIEVMSESSNNRERLALALLTDPDRLCEAADDLVDDYYPKLGIPMRTLDPAGRITHEITQVRFDAPHSAELLELPADYPVLTRAEVSERLRPAQAAGTLRHRQEHIRRRMQEPAAPRPESEGTD